MSIGLEMSLDTDVAAAVGAVPYGDRCFHLTVLHYGAADEVAAVVAGHSVWLDPMPNAGLLGALRKAGAWPRLLEAVDVAAASYEFKTAVRARRLTAEDHPALRDAMKYATRRPLATAFAFERRRVEVDMSVLNAAAFGCWGARVPEPDIL